MERKLPIKWQNFFCFPTICMSLTFLVLADFGQDVWNLPKIERKIFEKMNFFFFDHLQVVDYLCIHTF